MIFDQKSSKNDDFWSPHVPRSNGERVETIFDQKSTFFDNFLSKFDFFDKFLYPPQVLKVLGSLTKTWGGL